MKNKFLLTLLFALLLVSTVSALEFDNKIKDISPDLREMTITNSFLGIPTNDIGKLKLITPYVYEVIDGKDRLVGEFSINLTTDEYKEFVKNTRTIDLKVGEEINRPITYKKKVITYETETKYDNICSIIPNPMPNRIDMINSCVPIANGTYQKEIINWIEFTPKDLKKGETTIGVFADVYAGDYVDWKLSIFGVDIPWATWTASLNVGLVGYWKLNESTGGTAFNAVNPTTYYANVTDGVWNSTKYVFDNSYQLDGAGTAVTDSKINMSGSQLVWQTNLSYSFWIYPTLAACSDGYSSLVSAGVNNAQSLLVDFVGSTCQLRIHFAGGGGQTLSSGYATPNVWNHIVITHSQGGNTILYVNGTNKLTGTGNSWTNGTRLHFGRALDGAEKFTGNIDEIAVYNRTLSATEVSDLWNAGVGIQYTNVFTFITVENSFPTNNQNFTTSSISFGCNATSLGLTNISSIVLNVTGTSTWTQNLTGLNNQSYNATFTNTTTLNGAYTWNCIGFGNDGDNGTSSTFTFTQQAYTIPNAIFYNQTPTIIDNFNLGFAGGLNVSYNITSSVGIPINLSTVRLFHKTNGTRNDIRFINGTVNPASGTFDNSTYLSNISSIFTWNIDDDEVYPLVSNIDPDIFHSTIHYAFSLGTSNTYIQTYFLNVTNITRVNILEVMVNASTIANSLDIRYCNSSYSTGSITTDTNCGLVASWIPTPLFNYTDNQSKYKAFPITVNISEGTMGGVKITSTSSFAVRGTNPGSRDVYYINGTIRDGMVRTTTNAGTSWTTNNTIIPDMMLHQFTGNETLFYYAVANDTNGNYNQSINRTSLFAGNNFPPSPPQVYNPTANNFSGLITINYTQSMSPNDFPISYYNISLLNNTQGFVSTIRANNSLNLSYVWDSSTTPTGNYYIRVDVYDNMSQTSFGISEQFTIPFNFFNNNFNSSTYETSYEGFSVNLSEAVPAAVNSVKVIYAGIGNFSATKTGDFYNTNALIPTSFLGNKSWYWEVNYSGTTYTSITYYQNVLPISFILCNATNTVTYLNITFRDELTSTGINGTLIPLSVNYYLYNTSAYKTYTLTNSSVNNRAYGLCFTPNTTSLITDITGSSSMTGYPTRNWLNSYNLTSTMTTKAVDLLSSSDGVYQAVTVSNSAGTPIQGATVSASTVLLGIVDTRTTDVNGGVTLWLDPNKAHTLTTSASGYTNDIRTINPTPTTPVYVILGGTSTYPSNISTTYTEGISYSFLPATSTLYNDTTYTFAFNLSSGTWTVTQFGYNLINSTGSIVDTRTVMSNGGVAQGAYNVVGNNKMTMRAYYIVNGTTVYLSQVWAVMNSQDTGYSVSFLGQRIRTYIASGFFGLTTGFGLNLFCFIIIFLTIGSLSWKYGISNELVISTATLFMVWLFELGLGLIVIGGNIPLTFWVGIITIGLYIKEGLKLI